MIPNTLGTLFSVCATLTASPISFFDGRDDDNQNIILSLPLG